MTSFPKMEDIGTAEPKVHLTKCLRTRIQDISTQTSIEKQLKLELQTFCNDNVETIPFRLVRKIYELLKADGEKVYLHTLLEGSDLHLPTVKFPPRNEELEARIQKLRLEQDNREYKEMTRNVDMQQQIGALDLNVGQEVKSMNRQMVAVFNFLVTVGGAFAFGYKATEYALGEDSLAMQMMSGLFLGTIVFFADLYFLVKYSPE